MRASDKKKEIWMTLLDSRKEIYFFSKLQLTMHSVEFNIVNFFGSQADIRYYILSILYKLGKDNPNLYLLPVFLTDYL